MASLTKNAISLTVRDRAKRTKIWDNNNNKLLRGLTYLAKLISRRALKGYKSLITNIFKKSKFYKKKIKMAALTKNAVSVMVRTKNKKYFQKFKIF